MAKERNCIVKRAWEAATPYVQILGYLPLLGGVFTTIYIVCNFIGTTNAYGPSIEELRANQGQDHDRIISIQQEVHDIHEWIRP